MSADVEPIGGFALFVGPFGQSFYARPSWPASAVPTVGDVETVRARLRELGVPQAFEWVHEVRPDVLAVVVAAGLDVHRLPLMMLPRPRGDAPGPDIPDHYRVRILPADDPFLPGALFGLRVAAALSPPKFFPINANALSRCAMLTSRARSSHPYTQLEITPSNPTPAGAPKTASKSTSPRPISAG